ncbi:MAG: hypothetical protein F2932_03280, partial [Actinobacteria bacterium]|nr:hypothetical protein [Actinomycetota bacterium]
MPGSTAANTKPRLGNTRVTGKEQFYTPPDVAQAILKNVTKRVGDLAAHTLLEPAGGTGAFIEAGKNFGLTKVISYDIEPHHKKIKRGDFLAQN